MRSFTPSLVCRYVQCNLLRAPGPLKPVGLISVTCCVRALWQWCVVIVQRMLNNACGEQALPCAVVEQVVLPLSTPDSAVYRPGDDGAHCECEGQRAECERLELRPQPPTKGRNKKKTTTTGRPKKTYRTVGASNNCRHGRETGRPRRRGSTRAAPAEAS